MANPPGILNRKYTREDDPKSRRVTRKAKRKDRRIKKELQEVRERSNPAPPVISRTKASDFFNDLGTITVEAGKSLSRGQVPLIGDFINMPKGMQSIFPKTNLQAVEHNRENNLGDKALYTASGAATTANNAMLDATIGLVGGKAIAAAGKKVAPLLKRKQVLRKNKTLRYEYSDAELGLDFDDIDDKIEDFSDLGLDDIFAADLKLEKVAVKHGNEYVDELLSEGMIKRMEEFDKTHYTNFSRRAKEYRKIWDKNKVGDRNKKINAFDFTGTPDEKASGMNYIRDEAELKAYEAERSYYGRAPYTYDPRMIGLNTSKVKPSKSRDIIEHEIMHDFNIGGDMIEDSPGLLWAMEDIIKPWNGHPEVKEGIIAKGFSKPTWKNHQYISEPSETFSFLMTNLRSELLDAGIINNRLGKISEAALNKGLKAGVLPTYKRFGGYLNTDKFVDFFNKGFGATAGVGILGNQINNSNARTR